MVVHPGHGNYTGTLVNALIYHFQNLPIRSDAHPGLVHRLDKETSGLMIVAKNEIALARLAKEMFDRNISRRYQALVWGQPKENEGTINVNVGRSLSDRKKMAAFVDANHGKTAITHYKVLENFKYVSLSECKLETGRTHQIRVHFSHIGHPLFADDTYGGDRIVKGTIYSKYKQFVENCFSLCNRQALHAKSLGFIHPHTKEKVFFESDLPQDMIQVISKWRTYVSALNE